MVLSMPDAEFLKWCEEREDKRKAEKVKIFWRIINRIPFSWNIMKVINGFLNWIIRGMLSGKVPVSISYKLTKLMLRDKGKTQIIILARNNEGGVVHD